MIKKARQLLLMCMIMEQISRMANPNLCKSKDEKEAGSRLAFLSGKKVGQAKNGDLTHDGGGELGWRKIQLGFQDNRKMGGQTDVPGGGECEGNVGLADGQGGEEADEGPPVHHPHHAQPPPHRLRSLHHCTLPQIFSAIFPFTWCLALKKQIVMRVQL